MAPSGLQSLRKISHHLSHCFSHLGHLNKSTVSKQNLFQMATNSHSRYTMCILNMMHNRTIVEMKMILHNYENVANVHNFRNQDCCCSAAVSPTVRLTLRSRVAADLDILPIASGRCLKPRCRVSTCPLSDGWKATSI